MTIRNRARRSSRYAAATILLTLALLSAPPDAVSQERAESGETAGAVPSGFDESVSRILFGSCILQQRPVPILEAALRLDPGLFLFLGDNVYADTTDRRKMREAYDALAEQELFRRLREQVPHLAVWDDHDYGRNDAGARFPAKEMSEELFLDFWRVPEDSPRRSRRGIHDAARFGPSGRQLQVILLDTRFFRSPWQRGHTGPRQGSYAASTDPDATMLGEEQWAWLEEELRKPADLRLIVSSIQVLASHHGWEAWANFPLEQERLFSLIRDTRAEGVIFLSGDRHMAELSRLVPEDLYPLYDLTSSALNRDYPASRPSPNDYRVGELFFLDRNMGEIKVAWDRDDPVISLRIRDEAGEIRFEQRITRSELQFSR